MRDGECDLLVADISYNSARSKTIYETCTDLKLECVLRPVEEGDWKFSMILPDHGGPVRAEMDGSGRVVMKYNGFEAEANISPFSAGEGRLVTFSKVDYRCRISVDGEVVLESSEDQYDNAYQLACARVRTSNGAGSSDVTGIEMRGERGAFEVSHIRLFRDVHYIADSMNEDHGVRYKYAERLMGMDEDMFPRDWRVPASGSGGWGVHPNPIRLRRDPDNPDLDEFFCLGDNSPQSQDGRSWMAAAPTLRLYEDEKKTRPIYQLGTVPRYNLVGRAIWVYWPSGYRIPIFKDMNLPILSWPLIPNVGEMRLIR
jgi:hypothetical protein